MGISNKTIKLGSLFIGILSLFLSLIFGNQLLFYIAFLGFMIFIASSIAFFIGSNTKLCEIPQKNAVISNDEVKNPANQSKSNITYAVVGIALIIVGIALFIYGDFMSNRYSLPATYLHLYTKEHLQYSLMKLIGGVIVVTGFLSLIIPPLLRSKNKI